MTEKEVELYCNNCESIYRLVFDNSTYWHDPEICPFCGEPEVKDASDIDWEAYEDDPDEEEDEDDNRN